MIGTLAADLKSCYDELSKQSAAAADLLKGMQTPHTITTTFTATVAEHASNISKFKAKKFPKATYLTHPQTSNNIRRVLKEYQETINALNKILTNTPSIATPSQLQITYHNLVDPPLALHIPDNQESFFPDLSPKSRDLPSSFDLGPKEPIAPARALSLSISKENHDSLNNQTRSPSHGTYGLESVYLQKDQPKPSTPSPTLSTRSKDDSPKSFASSDVPNDYELISGDTEEGEEDEWLVLENT